MGGRGLLRIAALACLGTASALAQQAAFIPLGDLSGGRNWSRAAGVSVDGRVVVGVASSARADEEAFRWSAATGMVGLGVLPARPWSTASDASHDGSIVVGTSGNSPVEAFEWTELGGMVGLGFPNGDSSRAYAVSADGASVVGYVQSFAGNRAVRFGGPKGAVSLALGARGLGASADGSVIVGDIFGPNWRPIRWTSGTGITELLGGLPGWANGVSADGNVVVGDAHLQPTEAFVWTGRAGYRLLGMVGGAGASNALAASGDGSVVVGSSSEGTTDAAFIWDAEHEMRDLRAVLVNGFGLDLTGWELTPRSGFPAMERALLGSD